MFILESKIREINEYLKDYYVYDSIYRPTNRCDIRYISKDGKYVLMFTVSPNSITIYPSNIISAGEKEELFFITEINHTALFLDEFENDEFFQLSLEYDVESIKYLYKSLDVAELFILAKDTVVLSGDSYDAK